MTQGIDGRACMALFNRLLNPVLVVALLGSAAERVDANTCKATQISVPAVCGRVVSVDGLAIESAEVKIVDLTSGQVIRQTLTKEDGRFAIEGVEKGSYTLFITAPKYDHVKWLLRVSGTSGKTCKRQIVVSLALFNGWGCRSSVRVTRTK